MSRNNDVFQVLVTKGNQAVLAAGNKVTDLLPGQAGVFSFESNLSIDGTVPTRNFYVAVGLDEDGDGVTDNIRKSAGSHIQTRNIAFYSYRPFEAGRPMILEFKDFKTSCGEQYGIAIEFRNQQIYRTQGYVQFKVNYVVEGVCCDGCSTGCESGDDNLVAKKLVDAINNDPRGFVKAEMFNTTTNAVVTDYDAFVAANLVVNTDANLTNDVKLGVRITSIPQKINKYMGIDTKYFHMRETFLVPSKLIGFECNGEFSVKQTAKVTQGLGYDIQYLEYLAGGWNGNPGPYRTYKVNGLAKPITYVAETNTQYGILALTYDQFSIGGWLEYLNNEASIIAIPQADSVTRASLLGVIDKLAKLSNFDGLADDAAGYNVATPETDGLGDSTAVATRP